VQLAHAGDLGLAGLLVGADLEGRVLLGQAAERDDIFSWSIFVFGSIATLITGSGKVIVSSLIGLSGAASVSPVTTCLIPTPAAMSPA
jgi:hypothetical protein